MTVIVVPGIDTFPSGSIFPSADLWPSSGTWIFNTPYVQRRMPVIPPLTALINYSLAVLRISGQWVETEYPTEEQVTAADRYYEGGRIHMVGPAEAAELAVAGYTVEAVEDSAAAPDSARVGDAVVGVSAIG